MTKKQDNRGRTQINDQPRKEKELSKAEQKKVKGGTTWVQKDTCTTTTTVKAPSGDVSPTLDKRSV